MKLDEGELRRAIDPDIKVELTFLGPDLGDVDVKVGDRVRFELLLGRLLAGHVWQSADAVALQTSVKRRPGQVRDRGLQCIQTVVQR